MEAASAGDATARALFVEAADELAEIVDAVRNQLRVPAEEHLPVSCSGGMFEPHDLLRAPLKDALATPPRNYSFVGARLPSEAGAAVHAAHLSGTPIQAAGIAALEAHFGRSQDSSP